MLLNDERRAFKRLPVNCGVVVREPGGPELGRGSGKNLSGGGILFIAGQSLEIGAELEVSLVPSLERITPMTALIKVVRVERVERAAHDYEIAGSIQKVLS